MLMMTDKDETAFDDEASLIESVSMILILNSESVDVNDADLIWWSRTCSCNLMLLAYLTEQRRYAKASRRVASSACKRAFSFTLNFALQASCSAYMRAFSFTSTRAFSSWSWFL